MFVNNEAEAQQAKVIATEWLATMLHLHIHRTNNIVLPAKAGLYFLGHTIHSDSPLSVDKTMIRKIERDVRYQNIASYRAMALPKRFAKQLPWLLAAHVNDD